MSASQRTRNHQNAGFKEHKAQNLGLLCERREAGIQATGFCSTKYSLYHQKSLLVYVLSFLPLCTCVWRVCQTSWSLVHLNSNVQTLYYNCLVSMHLAQAVFHKCAKVKSYLRSKSMHQSGRSLGKSEVVQVKVSNIEMLPP